VTEASELGTKDWIARQVRNRSGPGTAGVARPLHVLSLSALGHGTATLNVGDSGERHVVDLLAQQTNPVIFDVGAYEGAYARMAQRILGESAVIHCFEPHPVSSARLKADAGSLDVHETALAARAGTSTLHEDPGYPNMATLAPDALPVAGRVADQRTTVEVTTLDEFCAGRSIERIDLLKIDVEGAELAVLQGATGLIDEDRIRIVQFEFGYGSLATRTFMRDYFELLGETRNFYRVAPGGLIPLGDYRLELEVFTSATNYVAVPR
jgi:FkbM family methyltransferase